MTKNITLSGRLNRYKKNKYLKILLEFFNESHTIDLKKAATYIFSKDFLDFCLHEIIPIKNQIRVINSILILMHNEEEYIETNFILCILGLMSFWNNKLVFHQYKICDEEIRIEGIYLIFLWTENIKKNENFNKDMSIFQAFPNQYKKQILKIIDTKEVNTRHIYFNYHLWKNIQILTRFAIKFDGFFNNFESFLAELVLFAKKKSKKYSILDTQCRIIQKSISNLLNLHKNKREEIKIVKAFNQICGFFYAKSFFIKFIISSKIPFFIRKDKRFLLFKRNKRRRNNNL